MATLLSCAASRRATASGVSLVAVLPVIVGSLNLLRPTETAPVVDRLTETEPEPVPPDRRPAALAHVPAPAAVLIARRHTWLLSEHLDALAIRRATRIHEVCQNRPGFHVSLGCFAPGVIRAATLTLGSPLFLCMLHVKSVVGPFRKLHPCPPTTLRMPPGVVLSIALPQLRCGPD